MDVKSMAEGYTNELLNRLGKLVSINSEQGKEEADAPFGQGPKKALETALEMLKEDGLKTVNLDNYIGYGEMGEGEQLIAIVGHLDVVPARKEDGWNSDPYTMIEKDGIVYGRGVSDDKGGVVASMIALKIIKDMGVPLNKRIRLIMGCNEETGSQCLQYYVDHDEQPDYGFTPDGDFPCINGEKGMMSAYYESKKTGIRDIQGGTAGNIVCSNCYVVVDKCSFSKKKLEDYFNNNNIEFEIEDIGETIKITVQGVAAHASMPTLGVNAISYLLTGLKDAGYQDPFVEFYCSRIGLNTNGEGMGLNLKDEYSDLTLNCGYIHMNDGVIKGNIDVRFPITMSGKQITKACEKYLEDDGGKIVINHTVDPLYYSVDSPLVESLWDAYREVTGDEREPMIIGGGTYAKGINNTIAFGCAFPDKDYKIHNANEWCPIEDLTRQVEIYVAGILKLLAL